MYFNFAFVCEKQPLSPGVLNELITFAVKVTQDRRPSCSKSSARCIIRKSASSPLKADFKGSGKDALDFVAANTQVSSVVMTIGTAIAAEVIVSYTTDVLSAEKINGALRPDVCSMVTGSLARTTPGRKPGQRLDVIAELLTVGSICHGYYGFACHGSQIAGAPYALLGGDSPERIIDINIDRIAHLSLEYTFVSQWATENLAGEYAWRNARPDARSASTEWPMAAFAKRAVRLTGEWH